MGMHTRDIPNMLLLLLCLPSIATALPSTKKYCLTPGCVKSAATLLQNIDMKKDPCDDFYEFACGKFNRDTVIPDHKSSHGRFSFLKDDLNQKLKKVFESEPSENEPNIFDSVRKFYSSCMDLDAIEENGKKDMKQLIEEVGGWPVLGHKLDPDFEWHKLAVKTDFVSYVSHNQPHGKIVSVGITTDTEDSANRLIRIDQPSLGLNREYLTKGFDDDDVQAYYRYMVEAAEYLGAEKDDAEQQMKEALQFELKLANLTLKREDRRNISALNNKMKLGDVGQYFNVDWVQITNQILNHSAINDEVVTKDEIVNVATPNFLVQVQKLLDNTEPKTIANYMMWRYVKDLFKFLDADARDITHQFNKVLRGSKRVAPRWETCVKEIAGVSLADIYWYEGSLTNAVGSMYARQYFPLENKEIVDEMVAMIVQEFQNILNEIDWMDVKTKQEALDKTKKMKTFMAYSKEILDDNLLNDFYEGFELSDDSYLKNYLKLKEHIKKYHIASFREKVDKFSWKTHGGAAVVNAFAASEENAIQFPAGFLDGVFFKADRPSYLNYGAIGVVIGHELTHLFDDTGSQWDKEGNLRNWWEAAAKKNYIEKTKCIVEQYSNFSATIDGEIFHVNGVNTQGENIADNGGYKESIRAYTRMTKQNGEEPWLPGLPYSPRQLFWLSGASVWCLAMRPAALKNRILTNSHAPGRFRINGSYKNMKEFAQDWNCPRGSPMNPVKKCAVW